MALTIAGALAAAFGLLFMEANNLGGERLGFGSRTVAAIVLAVGLVALAALMVVSSVAIRRHCSKQFAHIADPMKRERMIQWCQNGTSAGSGAVPSPEE